MIGCPNEPAWEQSAHGGEHVGPAERNRSVKASPRHWGFAKEDVVTRLVARHSTPPARLRFLSQRILSSFNNQFLRRFRSAEVDRNDGTTANERLRTMTSAETAKRLGP